jgi:serine/threonine protein kinase
LGWSRYLTQTYSRKLALTGYEAPEQATGDVSAATDVYSLGKILQTMLDEVTSGEKGLTHPPASIMRQLNALVASATEPSPDTRRSSVRRLQTTLEDIQVQVQNLDAQHKL